MSDVPAVPQGSDVSAPDVPEGSAVSAPDVTESTEASAPDVTESTEVSAPDVTDRDRWHAVDDYLTGLFIHEDEGLRAAREAGARGEVPAIEVSATQGAFLSLLVRMVRAERVLELGTLAGYSGVWLARGLSPTGRLVTCEFDQRHAEIAAETFRLAGVADLVEIKVGPALDTLDAFVVDGAPPFDLVFIDADKVNYPAYLARARSLSRPGTVIVADNVVRRGAVANAQSVDPVVQGVRGYLAQAAGDWLSTTVLQTVGAKGWDGLSISVVD